MGIKDVRRWWRNAGSAGQLGAVVTMVAIVVGAAVVLVPPLFDDAPSPLPTAAQPPPPNLAFAVNLPPVRNSCGSAWVVPGPVADGAKFPAEQAPPEGTLSAGSSIAIVVQETTGRTVVVHSLRVNVVGREQPVAGVLLQDAGCGGLLPISYLRADFDAAAPAVTVNLTKNPGGVTETRPPFPWTVAENDPVSYSVQLDVTDALVRFVFVIDWTWGDQRTQTTIDNNGQPFMVSSLQHVNAVMCADFTSDARGETWKAVGGGNQCQ